MAQFFISHSVLEASIAEVLQRHLKRAFPSASIFVSSDQRSIQGSRKWFDTIVEAARNADVLLVLLSDSSYRNTWMHFESGVSIGARKKVLPVAIRGFSFEKLSFPIAAYQGRYGYDLEGLLLDLGDAAGPASSDVDRATYVSELEAVEAIVTDKCIRVSPRPYDRDGMNTIYFEIENEGNTDVELLYLEVHVPNPLLPETGSPASLPPTLTFRRRSQETEFRLYAKDHPNGSIDALEAILTPSVRTRLLTQFPIRLRDRIPFLDRQRYRLRAHLHCRNLATEPAEVNLTELWASDTFLDNSDLD